MLLRGASVLSFFWWIALWVIVSRSAIEDLVYECHEAIHQAARTCKEYGIKCTVSTVSTDIQTHIERASPIHARTLTQTSREIGAIVGKAQNQLTTIFCFLGIWYSKEGEID